MIVIVDYDLGNLGSIRNMISRIGYESVITRDVDTLKMAKKIILPGVGAFDMGITNLTNFKLIEVLNDLVLTKKVPILGICLGMQLMTIKSEEGKLQGLGWVDAEVKKFQSKNIKIPHMGWNKVKPIRDESIFGNINHEIRYYFVHSYYVKCNAKKDILSTTVYENEFVSSFKKDNIFGVQFHPEKSHSFGFELIKNFLEL